MDVADASRDAEASELTRIAQRDIPRVVLPQAADTEKPPAEIDGRQAGGVGVDAVDGDATQALVVEVPGRAPNAEEPPEGGSP